MPSELRTAEIGKRYPGTVALDAVSVCFDGGRVHALLGKNGAGKSTLVKILAGTLQPDCGQIFLNGKPVVLRSAQDAFGQGIAAVYQEMSLIPGLTVAENILLGRLPHRRIMGVSVIDWRGTFAAARAVLDDMQVELDVRRTVAELSVAEQQMVEIAKAMSFAPSVLLLDEPTSALARHQTQALFDLVRKLARKGVAIIYITHRMEELGRICDTVTVLRDGKVVGHSEFNQCTPESIVHLMFGQVVPRSRPAQARAGNEPVLQVRGLARRGRFHDVNFTLHRGEVLGIAGTLGSGRTELLRAIFGADPVDGGEIIVGGQVVGRPDPARMKSLGIALTPEDRKHQGLVQRLSIRANLCMAGSQSAAGGWITTRRREMRAVRGLIDQLAIQTADAEAPVASLSGGNQQKVVIGKWLGTSPRIILLDEPTRGIDVQAKQQIFQIIWNLSRQGISSILVSSELEELLEVCHRIAIMRRGTITEELDPAEVSSDELYLRCIRE